MSDDALLTVNSGDHARRRRPAFEGSLLGAPVGGYGDEAAAMAAAVRSPVSRARGCERRSEKWNEIKQTIQHTNEQEIESA
eukprot:6198243-Pleurochrysis_carterae.AAC.2